jgi:AcrR family transcriptional regulator
MRERIVETATSLFVERGYDGVAMREISDACGITKASLYHYFAGKADLLSEIFSAYLDEMSAVIAAGVEGGGPVEEQLRRVVRGMFEVPVERRAILRLAMHDVGSLEPEHRAAFGKAYREKFLGPLQQLVAQGVSRGELVAKDPELVVWMLLGMVYPFFAPSRGARAAAGSATADDLLDVFCRGLVRTGFEPVP